VQIFFWGCCGVFLTFFISGCASQTTLSSSSITQVDFLGKWISSNNFQTIVITNNKFRLSDNDGDYIYFTIETWIASSNTHSRYNNEYPLGYLLTGRVYDSKVYAFNGTDIYAFLGNNGKNLIWFSIENYSDSSWNPNIFNKQE
jgi:hypothetical protein